MPNMAELKRRFFHFEIMHKGFTSHPMLDALTEKKLEENGKTLHIVKCFVPKIFSLLMWNNQRAHPSGCALSKKGFPTISDMLEKNGLFQHNITSHNNLLVAGIGIIFGLFALKNSNRHHLGRQIVVW